MSKKLINKFFLSYAFLSPALAFDDVEQYFKDTPEGEHI